MASKKTIDDLRDAIRKIEESSHPEEVIAPKRAERVHKNETIPSGNRLDSGGEGVQEGEELSRAFAKISRIVSISEKSSRQIRERLARDGFDEETINGALSRAQSCGMVDDARYAEWLVRSRIRQGRGIAGIKRDLAVEGFSLEDLPGWPEEYEYGDDSELERAMMFLDAHPPRAKNQRASAYRKLVSKGFSTTCASSASRAWCDNRDELDKH